MRAVWGKTEGRIGKIAINLHVTWEVLAGRIPSEFISKDVMVASVKLAKFYANQIQSLYFQFASTDNALAPSLAKVIELSRCKGWVKAKDVQLAINAKNRPSPDIARGWFHELVAMGKGQIRNQGRSIEFSVDPVDPKVDSIDLRVDLSRPHPQPLQDEKSSLVDPAFLKVDLSRPKVDPPSTATTLAMTGIQAKVDKVDEVDPVGNNISLITGQPAANLVDPEPPESTNPPQADLGSTGSTSLPNTQNHDTTSDVAVDPPSTLGLPRSTLESDEVLAAELEKTEAIAPQLPLEPQQATLDLATKTEFPNLGEVEVLHGNKWKSAILIQVPNDHLDPQQRITCWKVRLEGQTLCVWQASELRRVL